MCHLSTELNAPEAPSLKISKATAASHSSLFANTQVYLNEGNHIFKRIDCTPATAISSSSKSVRTSLSTAPWPSSSVTFPPFSPTSGTYSPSHMTSASGIPIISTIQPSSAMPHPPWHPPDHMTVTSALSVHLSSAQQATLM